MSEGQLQQIINSRNLLDYCSNSIISGHIHEAGNTMPGADNGQPRMIFTGYGRTPVKEECT